MFCFKRFPQRENNRFVYCKPNTGQNISPRKYNPLIYSQNILISRHCIYLMYIFTELFQTLELKRVSNPNIIIILIIHIEKIWPCFSSAITIEKCRITCLITWNKGILIQITWTVRATCNPQHFWPQVNTLHGFTEKPEQNDAIKI